MIQIILQNQYIFTWNFSLKLIVPVFNIKKIELEILTQQKETTKFYEHYILHVHSHMAVKSKFTYNFIYQTASLSFEQVKASSIFMQKQATNDS